MTFDLKRSRVKCSGNTHTEVCSTWWQFLGKKPSETVFLHLEYRGNKGCHYMACPTSKQLNGGGGDCIEKKKKKKSHLKVFHGSLQGCRVENKSSWVENEQFHPDMEAILYLQI